LIAYPSFKHYLFHVLICRDIAGSGGAKEPEKRLFLKTATEKPPKMFCLGKQFAEVF